MKVTIRVSYGAMAQYASRTGGYLYCFEKEFTVVGTTRGGTVTFEHEGTEYVADIGPKVQILGVQLK